jgi:hypothetical protein
VISIFKKAGIVGESGAPMKVEDLLLSVEKYYSPEQRLVNKLHDDAAFNGFIEANPSLVPSRQAPLNEDGSAQEETED